MKKQKAKSKPIHAWTLFCSYAGEEEPLFMAAHSIEDSRSKNAKLKCEILIEQFKQLYPERKYRVGKVTLMEGWK